MSRAKAWHKFYPEKEGKRLDRLWYDFQDLLENLKSSWYYAYLPKKLYELLDLANQLRYEAGACGHQANLRYKVAVLTSELKTYKENAVKAKEVKRKYNKLRRERSTHAQSKKY